jgi:hypothetical protein
MPQNTKLKEPQELFVSFSHPFRKSGLFASSKLFNHQQSKIPSASSVTFDAMAFLRFARFSGNKKGAKSQGLCIEGSGKPVSNKQQTTRTIGCEYRPVPC